MTLAESEEARAKVNLNLAVVGRDAVGYHLLETVMAFADGASDTVGLSVASEGPDRLALTGRFADNLLAETDNLLLRATRAIRQHVPRVPSVHWALDKRLPVAAGIGGGSADAGAALRLLGQRFDVDAGTLKEIAVGLGADVPVALYNRAVWATGRGETLADVRLPPVPAILVNAGEPCETPSVFKAYRDTGRAFSAPAEAPPKWSSRRDLIAWCRTAGNDLEPAARIVAPSFGAALAAIRATRACGFAAMSGSGATCFGLFEDASAARAAASAIAVDYPAWWVRAVTIR